MSTPTQKQQLDEALAKIADLEPKATASVELQTKLDGANGKVTAAEQATAAEKTRADQAEQTTRADGLQTRLDEANGKVSAAEEKLGKTEKERDDQKKRADDAEAKVDNADQRHQEQTAGRGIKPPQKDAASIVGKGDAKPTAAQIREEYHAIEDRAERRAFFKKHQSVLMAS